VNPLPELIYTPCPENLAKHFEDIDGMTYYEKRPIEQILFWVSDYSKSYIKTKPLHDSQTSLNGEVEKKLRLHYSQFDGGAFYTIYCNKNYELNTFPLFLWQGTHYPEFRWHH
jgi:hypothetical protein